MGFAVFHLRIISLRTALFLEGVLSMNCRQFHQHARGQLLEAAYIPSPLQKYKYFL